MYDNKKSGKRIWKKIGEILLEVIGEVIIMSVALATGIGILRLCKQKNILEQWDPEMVGFLGMLAILAVAGIIIALVKKKKK